MIMAKRGKRAGATNLEGGRTNVIHLKHSDDGILWEQTPEPVVKAKAKKAKKPAKTIEDLDGLISKVTKPMKKTQIIRLAIDEGHGSYYVANKEWKKIAAKLFKNADGLFQNNEPND